VTPFYADESVTVWHGDCLDVMRTMPDSSVDAIVTDPPYGLGFMGQKWDTYANETGRAPAAGATFDHVGGNHNPSNAADAARTRRVESLRFGEWCGPWTRECLRVLKPGGHLLAFGGTRTWHRLAVAVEDAGFEVRDSIAWLYGSGFPKSLDVSKAIDKANGRKFEDRYALGRHIRERREAVGLTRGEVNAWFGYRDGCEHWERQDPAGARVPTIADWQVLRERLQLSDDHLPVVERAEAERDVIGTRKAPGGEWTAEGRKRGGVGGYDIPITAPATPAAQQWQGWGTALKPAFEPVVVARKSLSGTVAATILAHGTGALNIDGCRVGTGDDRTSGGATGKRVDAGHGYGGGWSDAAKGRERPAGGRWPTNVVMDGDVADELDQQSGTLKSGAMRAGTRPKGERTTFGKDAAAGYETQRDTYADEGGASRFFPVFRYQAKAPTRERPTAVDEDGTTTAHPTVKPVELLRWMVRLVTPPGGVVLDPFAGTGTTAEACIVDGFRCVAIEREASHLPLIVARLSKPIALDLFGGMT